MFLTQNLLGAALADAADAAQPAGAQAQPVSAARAASARAAVLHDALAAIQSAHPVERSSLMAEPAPEDLPHGDGPEPASGACDAADLAAPPAELDDCDAPEPTREVSRAGASTSGSGGVGEAPSAGAAARADAISTSFGNSNSPVTASGTSFLLSSEEKRAAPASALKGGQLAGAASQSQPPAAAKAPDRRVSFGDSGGTGPNLRLKAPAALDHEAPAAGSDSSNASTEPGEPAGREPTGGGEIVSVPDLLAALSMSRFADALAEAGISTMDEVATAAQDPPRLLAAGLPAAAARRLAAAGRRIEAGVLRRPGGADGPGSPTEISMGLRSPTPPTTSLPPAPSRYRAGDASPPRPGQMRSGAPHSSAPSAEVSEPPAQALQAMPQGTSAAASAAGAETTERSQPNSERAPAPRPSTGVASQLRSQAPQPRLEGSTREAGAGQLSASGVASCLPGPAADGTTPQAAGTSPAGLAAPTSALQSMQPPDVPAVATAAVEVPVAATARAPDPAAAAAAVSAPGLSSMPPASAAAVAQAPAAALGATASGGVRLAAAPDDSLPADAPVSAVLGEPTVTAAPPLWEEFASQDGYVYFHRRDTGATQWERPAGASILTLEQKARSHAARRPVSKPASGTGTASGADSLPGADGVAAPGSVGDVGEGARAFYNTQPGGQDSRASAPHLLQLESPAADWRRTRLRARHNAGSTLLQSEFKSDRQRWRDAWKDVIAPYPADSLSAPGSPAPGSSPGSPPAGSGTVSHSLSGADTTAAPSPSSSAPQSPAVAPLPAPPLRFLQSQSAHLRGDDAPAAFSGHGAASPASQSGAGEPVADVVSRALALAAKARAAASSVPSARGGRARASDEAHGPPAAHSPLRGREPMPGPALSSWSRSPSPQRSSRVPAGSVTGSTAGPVSSAAGVAPASQAEAPKPADSWRLSGATITPGWKSGAAAGSPARQAGLGGASPHGRVTVSTAGGSPAHGSPTSPNHLPARFRKQGPAPAPAPVSGTPEVRRDGSVDGSQRAQPAQRPSLASFESPTSRAFTTQPARTAPSQPPATATAAAPDPAAAREAPGLEVSALPSHDDLSGRADPELQAAARAPRLRRAGSSLRVKSYADRQPDGWAAPRPSAAAESPVASAEMVGMRRGEAAFATSLRGGDMPGGSRLPAKPDGSTPGLGRSASFTAMRLGMDCAAPAESATGSYAYGHKAAAARAAGAGSVFDRLTDTRGYTGTHKHRFDSGGRGRGLRGRDSSDVDYEWVKQHSLGAPGAPVFTTNDAGSLAFGVRRLQ